jgi:RNA polymerase sigma-70 factor (ECF subfamily)
MAMSDPWATRQTLLLRVRNHADQDAWKEFDKLYRQLLVAVALKRGLQPDDAENLAQDVMLKVTKAMPRFEYDPEGKGRFRSWLFTIAYREIVSFQRKQKRQPRGSGADDVRDMLEEQPSREQEDEFEREYRQHLFTAALRKVREEVQPIAYDVFCRAMLDNKSNDEIAKEFNINYQQVANHKHRVLQKLCDHVRYLGEE